MTNISNNKYRKMLDHDHTLRLIIVGDYNTGKTTFLNTYIRQERIKTTYEPTIGIDFSSRNIVSNSGETIKLACWDTSGQETFKSIVRSYYRDICGVFLLFDVTNRRSFIHLQGWIADVYRNSSCKTHKHPILLLGNKIDKDLRTVTRSEALQFATNNGLQYAETSALTGDNLDVIIPEFVDHIMQVCGNTKCKGIKSRFNPNINKLDVENVSIEPHDEKSPSEKSCCNIS
jgi:small GTP-binding protein